MRKHIVLYSLAGLAVLAISTVMPVSAVHAQQLDQILRGYQIAPVPLNLIGKDWQRVGLGSYLVNTTGCNDCHTHPNWAPNGNPYLVGQVEQINTAEYMAGGRQFGPDPVDGHIVFSANMTPDKTGKPAGPN